MGSDGRETVEEWLAKGNKAQQVPPLDNAAVIESLKPKYKAMMEQVLNRNKPKEKAPK